MNRLLRCVTREVEHAVERKAALNRIPLARVSQHADRRAVPQEDGFLGDGFEAGPGRHQTGGDLKRRLFEQPLIVLALAEILDQGVENRLDLLVVLAEIEIDVAAHKATPDESVFAFADPNVDASSDRQLLGVQNDHSAVRAGRIELPAIVFGKRQVARDLLGAPAVENRQAAGLMRLATIAAECLGVNGTADVERGDLIA
ncbi:hypothetical protein NKH61_27730 [Mesorhizobium sp. M1005]|uniref:hypothetical protein n=1 Tax=unclassified Mesorhizobium TaxID=325217 RepID=UPI003335C4CB